LLTPPAARHKVRSPGGSAEPARPGRSLEEVPVASTQGDLDRSERIRRFVQGLTREERLLVVLKRELYEGRWEDMEADLRARLEGRPYVFKLVNRISEDLQRLERLREFERSKGVDLGEYVDLE
jgi:hypothetical protein